MIRLSEPQTAAEIFARHKARSRLPWMQREDQRAIWNLRAAQERREQEQHDEEQAAWAEAIRIKEEDLYFERIVSRIFEAMPRVAGRWIKKREARYRLLPKSPPKPDFIPVSHILIGVANEYGLTVEDLIGERKAHARARQVAYYLVCSIRKDLSIKAASRELNRDHTTLLSGLKAIRRRPSQMAVAEKLLVELLIGTSATIKGGQNAREGA